MNEEENAKPRRSRGGVSKDTVFNRFVSKYEPGRVYPKRETPKVDPPDDRHDLDKPESPENDRG